MCKEDKKNALYYSYHLKIIPSLKNVVWVVTLMLNLANKL